MYEVYNFVINFEKHWFPILLFCVTSIFHRLIKDPWLRKWYLTIQGFVCAYLLIGFRIWEYISAAIITSAMIKISGPKYCHFISLVVLIVSLNYHRFFYRENGNYMTFFFDLICMKFIAVMIGVSFDIYYSHKEKRDELEIYPKLYPQNGYVTNPSFWDLMHFSMFFLTIVGTFQRYRTYDDFLRLPFARHSKITKNIIWKFLIIIVLHFVYIELHGKYFPQEFLLTEDFTNCSMIYKTFYSVTQNHAFRLFLVNFMLTMEFVHYLMGFGAYPVQGENIPGYGPMKNYEKFSLMSEEECANLAYDFKTCQLIDLYSVYTSPWLFHLAKYWNMTVQYWLSSTTYKIFYPKYKVLGILSTALLSTLWHGYEFGFLMSFVILTFHAMTARLINKIYKYHTKGLLSIILMTVLKFFQELYMGMGMTCALLVSNDARKYLDDMHWIPVTSVIVFYILSLLAFKYINKKYKRKQISE